MLFLKTDDKRLKDFHTRNRKAKTGSRMHTFSQMREVHTLAMQGMSVTGISMETDIPRPTIHYWLNGDSVTFNKAVGIDQNTERTIYEDNDMATVVKLLAKGISMADVSRRMKIPYNTIKNWNSGNCQRYNNIRDLLLS